MSRRSAVFLVFTAMLAAPAQAQEAQQSDADIARNVLQTQGHLAPPLRKRCAAPTGGDIVVCAQDNTPFRMPSTADTDPNSKEALNDGRLTTPDVAGAGIFKGKPTMSGACLIPPCPPPKAYMIDLSQIPKPPPGSDADKIAKGELRAP